MDGPEITSAQIPSRSHGVLVDTLSGFGANGIEFRVAEGSTRLLHGSFTVACGINFLLLEFEWRVQK